MKKRLTLLFALVLSYSVAGQNNLLDSQNLINMTAGTPESLLEGRISGLWVSRTDGNPSSSIFSAIRGVSTLHGGSGPLWVVDGVILSDAEAQRVNTFFRSEYAPYQQTSQLNGLSYLNIYDIESIEVLKDVSATAIYGSKGANGVIIIKTKNPQEKELDLRLDSNLGLEMTGIGLAPSFSHNHNVSAHILSNRAGYSLSAYFRDKNHPVPGADEKMGGIRLKFHTHTNKLIWFGFNTNLALGRQSSMLASGDAGTSTMGTALRDLTLPYELNSIDGWAKDYDDINNQLRVNFDAYLRVNFLPVLYWETRVGADVGNNTRNHWFGLQTQLGAMKNRAAAYTLSSLKRYNIKSFLAYDMRFKYDHRICAEAGVVFENDKNRFEINAADHFLTDALRGDGMGFRESVPHPFWISYALNEFAAYGTLNYSWRDAIKVSAAFRADNCARYDDGEYSLYPSGTASIDLHKLFFEGAKAISSLSLEGGYGIAGMKRYVPYMALDRFVSQSTLNEVFNEKSIIVDPEDKTHNVTSFFEAFARTTVSEYHIDLNAAFISDRIRVAARWYNRKSNDSLNLYCFGKLASDKSHVWLKSPRWDVYEETLNFVNTGVEVEIGADLIRNKDITLTLLANGSYNDWSGAEDLKFNPLPTVLTGVGTQFTYKGFSAELWGNGAFGHKICNLNRMYSEGLTDETACVENAGYFSLSNIAVSYRFDIDRVKFIKSVKASVSASNILTMSEYSGLNPNINSYAFQGNRRLGYDYGSLPSATALMFGVSVIF